MFKGKILLIMFFIWNLYSAKSMLNLVPTKIRVFKSRVENRFKLLMVHFFRDCVYYNFFHIHSNHENLNTFFVWTMFKGQILLIMFFVWNLYGVESMLNLIQTNIRVFNNLGWASIQTIEAGHIFILFHGYVYYNLSMSIQTIDDGNIFSFNDKSILILSIFCFCYWSQPKPDSLKSFSGLISPF